jgi:hypothetical protein
MCLTGQWHLLVSSDIKSKPRTRAWARTARPLFASRDSAPAGQGLFHELGVKPAVVRYGVPSPPLRASQGCLLIVEEDRL